MGHHLVLKPLICIASIRTSKHSSMRCELKLQPLARSPSKSQDDHTNPGPYAMCFSSDGRDQTRAARFNFFRPDFVETKYCKDLSRLQIYTLGEKQSI